MSLVTYLPNPVFLVTSLHKHCNKANFPAAMLLSKEKELAESPVTVLVIALIKPLTYINGCEASVTSGDSDTLSTVKRGRMKIKVV
jgi:hypothetical protein